MDREILTRIDGMRGWAVELQRGLVAIPALDPGSGGEGEHDKAVWLEQVVRTVGFDSIDRYDAPDARAKNGVRPNLVARLRGETSDRTVWIMSHLDVVPPGELSMWTGDPWVLRVEGGRLYGRGVEDNHQALVSSLLVARAFIDARRRPPVDLALLFCADEETGSHYGAEWLVREHPELFGRGDAFLVPDAGNSEGTLLEVAEKSIWWLKVHTIGKQCHGSTPHLGVNAFRAASDLVVRLGSLYRTFSERDELFDPPISTFEPTRKDANVPNINTIPGDDVFYVDMRVLPQIRLGDVEAEILRLAAEVAAAHGASIAIEDVQRAEAAPGTSPDDPLVGRVAAAAQAVYGVTPQPMGSGGGTVAAVFRRAGFPAVVYSKLDDSAHQPDEWCNLSDLVGDAKVFALTLLSSAE